MHTQPLVLQRTPSSIPYIKNEPITYFSPTDPFSQRLIPSYMEFDPVEDGEAGQMTSTKLRV